MNSVTITGQVVGVPDHAYHGFTHVTEFDIEVPVQRRRTDRFHVVTLNDLAQSTAQLPAGTRVAITGTLRSEAYDMPDRSVWHKTEIRAYELDVVT